MQGLVKCVFQFKVPDRYRRINQMTPTLLAVFRYRKMSIQEISCSEEQCEGLSYSHMTVTAVKLVCSCFVVDVHLLLK